MKKMGVSTSSLQTDNERNKSSSIECQIAFTEIVNHLHPISVNGRVIPTIPLIKKCAGVELYYIKLP
jgi:hypothetical protein